MAKNSGNPAFSWKTSPDIASRKVASEVVLLNVKTSEYYSMNPTAVFIWEMISKGKGLEDIVGAVASEFDAEEPRIRKDVLELIKKLESEKLIFRAP